MKIAVPSSLRLQGRLRHFALLGAIAFVAVSSARSQTIISVNFQGNDTLALGPGDITGASPYSADNWNNFTGASGGPAGLNDSTGALSLVTLTSYSAGPFGAQGPNTANSNGQEILFGGALGVNFGDASFTLDGLSGFSSYDLIVYYSGGTSFASTRHADIIASGASTIYYVAGIDSVYTTFTQSDSSSSSTFDPGNYVVFSGLTDPTQTVTMEYDNNNMGLVGFQIIGTVVPEPGAWTLLTLGGLSLLLRRRKNRSDGTMCMPSLPLVNG